MLDTDFTDACVTPTMLAQHSFMLEPVSKFGRTNNKTFQTKKRKMFHQRSQSQPLLEDSIILFEFCELRGPKVVLACSRYPHPQLSIDNNFHTAVSAELDKLAGFVLACDVFPSTASTTLLLEKLTDSETSFNNHHVACRNSITSVVNGTTTDTINDKTHIPNGMRKASNTTLNRQAIRKRVSKQRLKSLLGSEKSAHLITPWSVTFDGDEYDLWCYLHYFTLHDNTARGSTRTLCFCVLVGSEQAALENFNSWKSFLLQCVDQLRIGAADKSGFYSGTKMGNKSTTGSSVSKRQKEVRRFSWPFNAADPQYTTSLLISRKEQRTLPVYIALDFPCLHIERRYFAAAGHHQSRNRTYSTSSSSTTITTMPSYSRSEVPPPTIHMLCGVHAKCALNSVRQRFPWRTRWYQNSSIR